MFEVLEALAWIAGAATFGCMVAGLVLGVEGSILHQSTERCPRCGAWCWPHGGIGHAHGCPVRAPWRIG